MVGILICGLMRTCCLSEAQGRQARSTRIRSKKCLARLSITLCVSMKLMLYEIGKNSHGPHTWQRQAQGDSASHDRQSPANGSCKTWDPVRTWKKQLSR